MLTQPVSCPAGRTPSHPTHWPLQPELQGFVVSVDSESESEVHWNAPVYPGHCYKFIDPDSATMLQVPCGLCWPRVRAYHIWVHLLRLLVRRVISRPFGEPMLSLVGLGGRYRYPAAAGADDTQAGRPRGAVGGRS